MKYERSGRCQTVTFWICYFCHAIKAAASLSSLILMSSRNVYRGTSITPEYTDFPTLHHSIPSGSSSRRHPENHEQSISNIREGSVPSRMHSWLASAKDVWQMNTGLLLVVASQAFFSLMNVSVKVLNSIDPPVTVLEVCLFVFMYSIFH